MKKVILSSVRFLPFVAASAMVLIVAGCGGSSTSTPDSILTKNAALPVQNTFPTKPTGVQMTSIPDNMSQAPSTTVSVDPECVTSNMKTQNTVMPMVSTTLSNQAAAAQAANNMTNVQAPTKSTMQAQMTSIPNNMSQAPSTTVVVAPVCVTSNSATQSPVVTSVPAVQTTLVNKVTTTTLMAPNAVKSTTTMPKLPTRLVTTTTIKK